MSEANPLTMTKAEREAFLAALHVGVISIEQADAAPLAVPIWYDYTPERGVWVITGESSVKGKALRAAGRFSICAQIEEPPGYQYVSVSGPIVEERAADIEEHSRPMAHRYFGQGMGDLYTDGQPHDGQLLFVMRPERWRTVDYRKIMPSS
jgi:nitroimidazol reductase NimA-like FMN-containing flavoprotein (pyridoxamine 5'-phosphate oxidase superfamily)